MASIPIPTAIGFATTLLEKPILSPDKMDAIDMRVEVPRLLELYWL
jgi:hypothetical protein